MGASEFVTYQAGIRANSAFRLAVDEAMFEYGNAGYTGTIAEKKDGIVIITETPMPLAQAEQLAEQLLANQDPRVADQRGAAGAIPVIGGRREHKVTIPVTPGGYANKDEAANAAVAGRLAEGEQVAYGVVGQYEVDAAGRIVSGELTVPTEGANVHTGWLFVGVASS